MSLYYSHLSAALVYDGARTPIDNIILVYRLTDPLPMAHLNDSDLWSHSLQMTSERELPSKEQMEVLLNLYFQFMYPFAPMFIRKTFMDDFRQNRPDLSQILILNAIFSNACWYSDDPALKQESTKYFNRAKIILDETYHVSRISTVQALLLMAHHQYATGNYSGGWLYTGMSIRIAQVSRIVCACRVLFFHVLLANSL